MAKTKTYSKNVKKTQPAVTVSPVMIGVVIVAAILLVGGLIVLGNQSRAGAAVDESQFPTLGDPNAPVIMTEFSDYGCSHCRDFVLEKFDRLKAEYFDTGKVKFVAHPFNLGRPDLALATEAAWCAQDQGQYFEYMHTLFVKQGQIPFSQDALTTVATEIGLDQGAFAQCLSSREHQADVENARRAAANRGINATPTFFINKQRVEGNQPYEVFKKIIDQELGIVQ